VYEVDGILFEVKYEADFSLKSRFWQNQLFNGLQKCKTTTIVVIKNYTVLQKDIICIYILKNC